MPGKWTVGHFLSFYKARSGAAGAALQQLRYYIGILLFQQGYQAPHRR